MVGVLTSSSVGALDETSIATEIITSDVAEIGSAVGSASRRLLPHEIHVPTWTRASELQPHAEEFIRHLSAQWYSKSKGEDAATSDIDLVVISEKLAYPDL
jgi:hypothetical protein